MKLLVEILSAIQKNIAIFNLQYVLADFSCLVAVMEQAFEVDSSSTAIAIAILEQK